MTEQKNWAGNHTYHAARRHAPKTVAQVQELVTRCSKIKALGMRHSFNSIADTDGDHLSLEYLNQVTALDGERRTVTIEGGMRYGPLCRYLHQQGYALHNLASLPHISVAGACATATHGSGNSNGNLATAVSAMEIVTANGEIKRLSREQDGELFQGAVVGLGGLGVVTQLTLDIVPTYDLRQDVYENLPFAHLEDHFDAISSDAYSVSLFTDWQSANVNQVWLKRRVQEGDSFAPESAWHGAVLAVNTLHPIAGLSVENCTEQMGLHGPWHERLPHFRIDYMPSSSEELQSEYFVPRRYAFAALRGIETLREDIAPLLQVSEVRTISADTLWMSPCYQQDSIAIHFTWKQDWPAVERLLPRIEDQLAPFNARPHWGKLFTMLPERLQSLYPRLPDFQHLLRAYDPQGKFRNAFLNTYLSDEHREIGNR